MKIYKLVFLILFSAFFFMTAEASWITKKNDKNNEITKEITKKNSNYLKLKNKEIKKNKKEFKKEEKKITKEVKSWIKKKTKTKYLRYEELPKMQFILQGRMSQKHFWFMVM